MRNLAYSQPRYVRIAEELARQIESGRYKVGDLLPSEAEICEGYGVSHHTARSAVAILQRMRLVRSEQGRGSRVTSNTTRGRFVHRLDTIPELGALADEARITVIKRELIEATDAKEVTLPNIERWYRIEVVRYLNKSDPLMWKEVFLPDRFERAVKAIGKSHAPIYRLVEEYYGEGPERVDQEISATLIQGGIAKRLGVPEGSPGLVIDRRYFGINDRVIQVARGVYRADKFRYGSHLQREI